METKEDLKWYQEYRRKFLNLPVEKRIFKNKKKKFDKRKYSR
jgi:hypothetical protein